MKVLLGSAGVLFASAALSLGAAISSTTIHGNYVEARTADVFTGPCFANAEVGLMGELAVIGWNVSQGSWHGVNLDGLSVVGVVRARHTLGDAYETSYPVKSVLIVDSRANAEQRLALQSFAKRMAGDLLQDVVRVDYQPINLSFDNNDVHSMKAHLSAGKLANIETRAINEGDHICRNEEVWYRPLSKVDHAMPAYSLAHNFSGEGLGTKWSNPYKRSAFVGTFVQDSE
jgi:hypothetical protein